MFKITIKLVFALGMLVMSAPAHAQCNILHRIAPDGSMMYYMEPVNFYWTKAKSLRGNLVTDKENYYLAIQPTPCPDKSKGKKLKSDLELKLSNGQTYMLAHYDTRYLNNDSTMELLYFIDKKQMPDVAKYEAVSAKIDMKGDEGIRQYVFKLHKKALMEQFACFLEMKSTKAEK